MENITFAQLVVYLLTTLVAFVLPLWKVLPRAGLSKWIALFGFVPLGVAVILWVLAVNEWSDNPNARLTRRSPMRKYGSDGESSSS